MLTDYKFKRIVRDGQTTKVLVSFYEGDLALDEEAVLKYKRQAKLSSKEYSFDGTKTDDEIRAELNKELGKDLIRTAINEQKIQQLEVK